MVGNYKVVTLCGSTKFKDDFTRVQKELTLKGKVVISVGVFGHSDPLIKNGYLSTTQKQMLDDMHKYKIDMADEIFVINVGGYIGSSTKSEIEYAIKTRKPVGYLVSMKAQCKDNSHTWRNCLTIDKVYDVSKHYIDDYGTEIVEIVRDDGEPGVYRANRFNLQN